VFVPVTPFRDLPIPGLGVLSGVSQLYLLGALSIVVGIYTYSQKMMKTVGKELFRLSPITGLIAVLAESLVLFLFSSKGLHDLLLKFGLPAIPLVPVSASQIIVGSILGIGLVKGGKNLKYTMLGRISIGWIAAPLLAFGFSFVALFIVQNVFEQTVKQHYTYVFNQSTLSQMQSEGVNIDRLFMVNGRTYDQERVVYRLLTKETGLDRQAIYDIVRTAEINKVKVDMQLAAKRKLADQLSEQQYQSLARLDGKKYQHNWQLKNALRQLPGWEGISSPLTALEREQNLKLENRLDLLCREFANK
jgi:PiT family inorganic phosphate transporter